MKYLIFIVLISCFTFLSCGSTNTYVIHPKIAKTLDACLNDFVEEMGWPGITINDRIIKDFDSINIHVVFFQDTNNNLCYDVFAFHRLADESSLLGCYPLDNRTLLYIYDKSGYAHNFIDTTQLLKPWTSRFNHVIRYPDSIDGEPVIEGLEYSYIIGYKMIFKEMAGTMYLLSIKKREASTINKKYYSFYPQMKWFLGL